MNELWLEIVLPALVALLLSWGFYPLMRWLALRLGIVDHPNERRLNKNIIPVMGGVEIFSAAVLTIVAFAFILDIPLYFNILIMIAVLTIVGMIDDKHNIRWSLKLLFELLLFWGLMHYSELLIDGFHGLWGIDELPVWFSYLFTFLLFVGITNGVNLMDGINGLASGYGIMAFLFLGLYFWGAGAVDFAMPAFVNLGAIIPFWVYNVFSRKRKMFMGDAGSLTLGLCLTVFGVRAIQIETLDAGIVSYVLAILAVPVFDTLRVMAVRMVKGRSPFSPDKSHLHHIFIDLGLLHIVSTFAIIGLNLLVILTWWICQWCGAGIDIQFWVVFVMGIIVTSGVYYPLSHIRRFYPETWARWQEGNRKRDIGRKTVNMVSSIVDGKYDN